jgi:4-amino-4-deoxy-L-arabinose transferase-like glycosyltransferase
MPNNNKSKLSYYFKDAQLRVLLIILFIGFLARFWGIWNIEQTDEFNEVFEALKVDSGRLNLDRWNKKVLVYILAVEYGSYFCFGWIGGIFSSVSDFASKTVSDMSALFIIGRATSAFFGTAIILMTYKIASLLFSRRVGLVASLFICFNVVHVEHSHLVLVDITMCLAVACSFFFLTKLSYWGGKKSYFLAGLFAGLAIVAKIPSVFILISLITGHVMFCYRGGKKMGEIGCHSNFILLLGGIAIGMVVGSPGILVAPGRYFKYMLSLVGAYEGTGDEITYFMSGNGYIFYLKSMAKNMGLPIFICLVSSIFLLFVRNDRKKIILLLSFPLPFYLFMSNSKWFLADRYLIPIYPFLSVLAGRVVVGAGEKFERKWLLTAVCVALVVVPGVRISAFEASLARENTRLWAREWIEENIAPGCKILIDSGRTINTYSPPIFPSADNVREMMLKVESLEEGTTYDESRIADAKSVDYFKYLLEALPEVTYDLTSTERGEAVHNYSYYVEAGFDYIITSDAITWRTKVSAWRNAFPEQAKFYDYLETLQPIRVFLPGRFRSGPCIKIYRVTG